MVKNMNELRTKLSSVMDRVEKDKAFIPQAMEINNAAGKLIGTVRTELEYYKLRREKPPRMPFVCGGK